MWSSPKLDSRPVLPVWAPTGRSKTGHGGAGACDPVTHLTDCPTGVVLERGRESQTGYPSGHSPGHPALMRWGHPREGETVLTIILIDAGCSRGAEPASRARGEREG